MPRTKGQNPTLDYGRGITNIKNTVIYLLNRLFTTDRMEQRLPVQPLILAFSIEEDDPVTRRLEIIKRLSVVDQHLPCIVLSEARGTFTKIQLGSGASETYINPFDGRKYLGYTYWSNDPSVTLDLFAEDPDTRDLLGDACTSGLLTLLRDLNYSISQSEQTGYYTMVFDATIVRGPGSDEEWDNDPTRKILSESEEVKLALYEETVFIEAVPTDLVSDAVAMGLQGFHPVSNLEPYINVETNIPEALRLGDPFQAAIRGGSGFYAYESSDPDTIRVTQGGILTPVATGDVDIRVRDIMNSREFLIPTKVGI